jgi:NitT/TauT family transport system substrate-binding protein
VSNVALILDRTGRLLFRCLLVLALASPAAAAETPMRFGVLKFGTVSWELQVIQRHGLDRSEGLTLEILELATNQAAQVALQAGRVDAIVSDWFWVSRQRAQGADWTFFPFSTALGAVVVPAGSGIHSLAELTGRRLGIAGSPLDKSWLMLRAVAWQKHDLDLNDAVTKSFGAPPLIGEQLQSGRLDAVLTYWPFAARLEARGMIRMLGVDQMMRELGVQKPIPLVGYVVSERWANDHSATVQAFVRASRQARQILANSDAEWEAVAPITGAADRNELMRIRDAFRAGIPQSWGEEERRDAARLYRLLAEVGGEALVGRSTDVQPGTFLSVVRY